MIRRFLAQTRRLVVTLAVIGLVIGGLTSYIALREDRFVAQANLAMVPGPQVPPEVALSFWEVLNRGQATRTAALTLQDPRWLAVISEETGFPASDFVLTAGAIPDTTLIQVNVQAGSAWAAERGLGIVVADGVGYAQKVSGPFTIETMSVSYNKAQSLSPLLAQKIGAFALVGLLIGAGAGLLIGRRTQRRRAEHRSENPQPPVDMSARRNEVNNVGRLAEKSGSLPKLSH